MRHLHHLWLTLGASVYLAPSWALAAFSNAKPQAGNLGNLEFGAALGRIFEIIIIVAGVAFVALFFVGGVMYLTSLGNEDGTKKARQLMLDAVIGLVIVVIAWSAGNWVLTLLKLNINVTTGGVSGL